MKSHNVETPLLNHITYLLTYLLSYTVLTSVFKLFFMQVLFFKKLGPFKSIFINDIFF